MEYTKGEWKATLEDGEWCVKADNVDYVCNCDWGANQLTCEANAQLIAAAPDMYEACKDAIELLEINLEYNRGKVSVLLKKALAKAEGK